MCHHALLTVTNGVHVFGYLSVHLDTPNGFSFTSSSKAVGQSVLHFPSKSLSCPPSENRQMDSKE